MRKRADNPPLHVPAAAPAPTAPPRPRRAATAAPRPPWRPPGSSQGARACGAAAGGAPGRPGGERAGGAPGRGRAGTMLMDPHPWPLPDGRARGSSPPGAGLYPYPFADAMLPLELDDLNILAGPGGAPEAQAQLALHPGLAGRREGRGAEAGRLEVAGSSGGGDFPTDQVETGPSADEEARKKRARVLLEQQSLDVFLQDLAHEEAASSRQEPPEGRDGPTSSGERDRKPLDALAAARTKASRERMRRERLNERCCAGGLHCVLQLGGGAAAVLRAPWLN